MRERAPIWAARTVLTLPVVGLVAGLWFWTFRDSNRWWPLGRPFRHGGNVLEAIAFFISWGIALVAMVFVICGVWICLSEATKWLWSFARRKPSQPLVRGRVGRR